jgi:crotonobetainyl-CoA:carnitine CoA-transferase CaiB-like acyl-CoA transferase
MAPLEGLKVLDLTRVLAGPFCTQLLGDMGADVIKIEEPSLGDDTRGWAPFVDGWSSYFLGVNRNKRSLALDLKSPAGVEVFTRLVGDADVLVENLRPGTLARLGFGYAEASALNPRIVYASVTGYGQTGPRRDDAGYDPVAQAEAGVMMVTGPADGEPSRVGVAITDFLAGQFMFSGILLALRDRERTGRGQQVDVALFDAILATMTLPAGIAFATGAPPPRMGNTHPSIAPYETFATRAPGLIHRFSAITTATTLCCAPCKSASSRASVATRAARAPMRSSRCGSAMKPSRKPQNKSPPPKVRGSPSNSSASRDRTSSASP